MNQVCEFSDTQLDAYEELIKPDSNWPNELREKFEQRCGANPGYNPNLDSEVISEYVKEKFS